MLTVRRIVVFEVEALPTNAHSKRALTEGEGVGVGVGLATFVLALPPAAWAVIKIYTWAKEQRGSFEGKYRVLA